MRIVSFTFETHLTMDEDVRDHDFVLRCRPTSNCGQTVMEAQVVIAPDCAHAQQRDGFGNALEVGRIAEPHRSFSYISSGMAMIDRGPEAPLAPMPAHPMFSRPSRFAAADAGEAGIAAFAADVLRVRGNADAGVKARLLSHEVFCHMTYAPGATDVRTDAAAAFAQAQGVCQDYAHILIAALRAAGVPARYVSGLMLGEGATHAWVEYHDGTFWRGIDPTNDRLVSDDYLVIARGRDFADCPIEAGVFRGGARQEQTVTVQVSDQ